MNDDKNFMKKAKSRKKAAALEHYCELLDRTCVFWPKDAFQQIKKVKTNCPKYCSYAIAIFIMLVVSMAIFT